jgi:IS5 family transposase
MFRINSHNKYLNPLFTRTTLCDTLEQTNMLIVLAKAINWHELECELSAFYNSSIGRPSLPIRLMAGLLMLKYISNLSDEEVIEAWSRDMYFQAFTGAVEITIYPPSNMSQLTVFGQKIGEKGAMMIFTESVRVHDIETLEEICSKDTIVQEKNITYPTDSKLILKSIDKILHIGNFLEINFSETFNKDIKALKNKLNFGKRKMNQDEREQHIESLRTIANKLLLELKSNIHASQCSPKLDKLLSTLGKTIIQRRSDSKKLYSLHEPQVPCIAKGKDRVKHEFGTKVAFTTGGKRGIMLGALNLSGNPYDGDTVEPVLVQMAEMHGGFKPFAMVGDRGYRGRSDVNGVMVMTPYDLSGDRESAYKEAFKEVMGDRIIIEPIIGHVKRDHRMDRNYLHGELGDAMNPLLAAAAFNFRKLARTVSDKISKPTRLIGRLARRLRKKYCRLPLWRQNPCGLFK